AEKTVAFAEFEDFSLPAKMQSTSDLSKGQLEASLKSLLNIEDLSEVEKWAKERFGIVLIQDEKSANIPVYFVQTSSRRNALKFFESLALHGEGLTKTGNLRLPIYSYPQGQAFSFAFIGPFVFVSNEIKTLESLQDTFEAKITPLTDDVDYQKSISNLPRQSWMTGYINFQALESENMAVSNIIEPLKYAIDHFAITVRKEQNGFHFNTFLNLNKNLLPLGSGYSDSTKFAFNLTDYIKSDDVALYIGGANLSDEWLNTLETISNLNPAYGVILESLIRAQVSNVFGDQVTLRNDLYPLFEGEYAIAIALGEDDEMNLSLILSHDDQDFVDAKLEKMMKGFRYLAAKFAPRLHVVTLPDGSESRELVADSSQLDESTEKYEGYEINCMEVKGTNSGFCYTTTDELIIITNKRQGVIDAIDLGSTPTNVLSQYQPFRQTIGNLSKVSDEVTFIDVQKTIPIFSNHPYGMLLAPFLEKFDAVTWVKHYFDDGVSAEGFVLIK
ncbi:DUF3352 domain-containing protein, partial [Patescibacteria group bacterium]|nr:DUF3352 domain-containing protein [Patescibacteria group bacterium]